MVHLALITGVYELLWNEDMYSLLLSLELKLIMIYFSDLLYHLFTAADMFVSSFWANNLIL